MSKLEEMLSTAKLNELLSATKLNELRNKKKPCCESHKKNPLCCVLVVVGIIAAVAGIAYLVYRFVAPKYMDDFDDDFCCDDLDEEIQVKEEASDTEEEASTEETTAE